MTTERTKARLVSLCDELRDHGHEPGSVAGWSWEKTEQWYLRLIEAGLKDKSLPIAAAMVELLSVRRPDTVRGTMYAVVSAGWLPDTSKPSYNRVQRLLNDLRKKRVIPFSWIVDNLRSTIKPSSWSGLDDFAYTVAHAYRKDFWSSLPEYLCVIVEKDTVASALESVTTEYDVSLHPLRGQSSTTFSHDIGQGWKDIDKPIHVIYIGDHDPSGICIEEVIQREAEHYAGRPVDSWTRLAVLPEDFDTYNIKPLIAKKSDKNYPAFIERFGSVNAAEVEAIPAHELRRLLKQEIEYFIPSERWANLQEIENQERETWTSVMAKLETKP